MDFSSSLAKRGETTRTGRKWPERRDGPDTEVFHVVYLVEMLRLFLLMLLLLLFAYVVVVAVFVVVAW